MALIRDIAIGMSVNSRDFNAKLKSAEARLGSFANSTISVRSALGALAGAMALRQAGRGILGAVQSASDLNEQLSKSQTVFGAAAAGVESDAKKMADAFGYPKAQFIEGASSIGLIAKASGLSQSAAADLGSSFAKLSADASSFYNVPVDEALGAIRSGLVGEAEPMRRFGVLLNEAAVASEAARMGLVAVNGKLTEGQKVQARSALITRGLADAQGDLERTAGSAANKIRTIWGRLTNLGAELGTALQPATDAILGLADNAFSYLGDAIDRNKETIIGWVQTGVAKVLELGFVFRILPDLVEIAGIKIGELVENMSRRFSAFSENIMIIGKYIADNWVQFFVDAFNFTGTLATNLFTNLKNLISSFLASIFSGDAFEFTFTPLLDGFEATMAELPQLAAPALVDFQDQIDKKFDEIGQREAARAANLTQKAPIAVPKAAPGGPLPATIAAKKMGKEKEAPRFAAALDARSAEAYSQQLKFLSQGPARKDEPIKEVVKKANVQIDLQTRIATGIEKILENTVGRLGGLFQI
jgi:hypothetical protein